MERMNSPSALLYVERVLFTTLVDGGVTTIRDVGGATHMVKRLVDDGVVIGPRLKIAICMLSTTGGTCRFSRPRSLLRRNVQIMAAWAGSAIQHC